jgi:hypothetical protein
MRSVGLSVTHALMELSTSRTLIANESINFCSVVSLYSTKLHLLLLSAADEVWLVLNVSAITVKLI